VDPNIYKNGLAVAIPGARGATGIDLAALLGIFKGDSSLRLEVLDKVDDDSLEKAKEFIRDHPVGIEVLNDKKIIYIRVKITAGSDTAEAVIEELHDNIVSLSLNGKSLKGHKLLSNTARTQDSVHKMEAWLKKRTLEELIQMLDQLDEEDLEFLKEGVEVNMRLAEHGRTFGSGLGVGMTLERLAREGHMKRDMVLAARILASSASDARMSGVRLPAMSSAGSGNHGLTAILPIWAVKDFIDCGDETLVLRAIALSHVITAYIKAFTGRLGAICGCSVAAGSGATGGITYLMGGNAENIAAAIKNVIGDLAGVICDGAKAGCALKLSTAAGTAVQSALFALHGLGIKGTDGIVSNSPEETMRNVGELSSEGMIETDRTILNIMIKKQFSKKN